MKNINPFLSFFYIVVITYHTALFAQEKFDYEKQCEKIDSYVFSGDFDRGINYLKQKIAVYDSTGTVPDSNCSFFMQELAKMYYYKDDVKQAEKYMLHSLALDKKLKGETSNDYIVGLSSLIELYRLMGFYEKALDICDQLSALYSQIKITDSIGYAFYLNNCGNAYYSIGNLSEAEKFFKQAKVVNDRLFEPGHPDKCPLLNNLAGVYKSKGEYAKAEKIYGELLRIEKTHYGNKHTFVAMDLNNLADLNITIGNLSQAEKQLNRAKKIYEDIDNRNHMYIYVLTNLAEV